MRQFTGFTFVCFIDISGFKNEMVRNLEGAARMLDVFYSAGYRAVKSRPSLSGIFVSDCGVIYGHKNKLTMRLNDLLAAVKDINQGMIVENYLTTTSITYGYLQYRKKFAFNRFDKNAFLGNGYLNAYRDSVDKENKVLPGQVRILKKVEINPPKDVFDGIVLNHDVKSLLEEKDTHHYYHWYITKAASKQKIWPMYEIFKELDEDRRYDFLKGRLKTL